MTEQTEITEQTEKSEKFLFVSLFPFVPSSLLLLDITTKSAVVGRIEVRL
jgi:hypothetical protein